MKCKEKFDEIQEETPSIGYGLARSKMVAQQGVMS